MIKSKVASFFILALFSITVLSAQSNIGVDYYRLGENEKAKVYLKNNLNSFPEEINFYLGEIAFSEGNFEEAEEYYNKVLSINPKNSYGEIGLTKLKLRSDQKSADAILSSISKKNKKDANIILAVARAYLDNNLLEKAERELGNARKADAKNPDVYILEGDIILKRDAKRLGEAAAKYEMAIYFAPEYGLGYLKTAQVYEYINSNLAIEKLKTIIEKQPDYIIAYGYLGKIYTQKGFYPQAINAFRTYFEAGNYSIDDIERYARALYFTGDYTNARKMAIRGLEKNPNHFVLNRYLMYIEAKTKNVGEGLNVAGKFFSLREPSGYIDQDYTMYASILSMANRYDEVYVQYDKAISMEPDKIDLYQEASAMAREEKDYATAASYLRRQMDKKAELADYSEYVDDVVDISTLGYDYYSAGVTISKNQPVAEKKMANRQLIDQLIASNNNLILDSLQNNQDYFNRNYSLYYLNKADSVFDILIERVPDSYSAYRFKALTRHAINPDTEAGFAKPYYEKVVEILSDKELTSAIRAILLEAYNYLGYYYYMKSDKANTILYWNKVLELDPENKNAKLVLQDINQ